MLLDKKRIIVVISQSCPGLRSAIPYFLRKDDGDSNITKLGFFRNDAFYDVSLAKSKQYYNLLIQLKATLPNAAKTLKDKLNMRHEDYLRYTFYQ